MLEYITYSGFENEFRKITKKMSTIEYYEKNYEKEISNYVEEEIEDKNTYIQSDEEESEEEDVFGEFSNDKNNKKKNKIKLIKEDHLFYYNITKNKEDALICNVLLIDNSLNKWVDEFSSCIVRPFGNIPSIEACDLFCIINDLKISYERQKKKNPKHLLFLDYIRQIFKKDLDNVDKMLDTGMFSFDYIWFYFDKMDTIYVTEVMNDKIAFIYKSCTHTTSQNGDEKILYLNGDIKLCNSKNNLFDAQFKYCIPYYSGLKNINDFNIKPITEEQSTEFVSRFDIIKKYSSNICHMKLEGSQYIKSDNNIFELKKNERVMVDNENIKIGALLPANIMKYYGVKDEKNTEEEKKICKLTLFPFIPIYNLGFIKTWGLCFYNNLKEITYDKEMYNKIVMKPSKKDIISKLAVDYDSSKLNNNLVKNKGNNMIFLLHGPPGVGKTLTAEGISELVERPLYKVNISDLDLNPSALELKLSEINKLSRQWNSILLLDEADIFLEMRDLNNIARNTMVSIFLNFLEYNKNLIFLTTNRLETIDAAVKSRINLIITYPKLEQKQRKEILTNLLINKDINDKNKLIKDLAKLDINGREICNMLDIVFVILNKEKYESDEIKDLFNQIMTINTESSFKIKDTYLYT